MNAPKAVLFDLEGTVLKEERFDPAAGTARLIELAENSHAVSHQEVQRLAAELDAELMPRKYSSLIELPWRAFNRQLFERLGITVPLSAAQAELEFWKTAEIMAPTTGIGLVLQALAQSNIPTGIVSNSAFHEDTLRWELTRHGLIDWLQFVISSSDYGVRKPHPFLFLVAAARLGLQPCDVWFVGDSLAYDVAGARGASMTSIWYNPGALPCDGPAPDMEIRQWEEFLEVIQACN